MAKRKQCNPQRARLAIPLRVEKHIQRLGLTRTDEYLSWCRTHRFEASFQKTWNALEREWCAHGMEPERARARQTVQRDPAKLLLSLCQGRASVEDFSRPRWRALAARLGRSELTKPQRRALCELVEVVERRGNLLLAELGFGDEVFPLVDGMVSLARRHDAWLRRAGSWRPRSHNARRQFASLTRHLLADYPVPAFLDGAWLRSDPDAGRYRDWFIRIGTGQSVRASPSPIELTNRILHQFMGSPERCSVEQALRWGQVHAMGGDRRLAKAILGTRLGASFDHEGFWVTVLRFFVQQPLLDRAHVAPIVDYLQNQRFEAGEVFVAEGVRQRREPAQPNLTLQGRSPHALLRQMQAWHRELAKAGAFREAQWAHSGIGELELETGVRGRNLRVWRIRELLSAKELHAEGRAMRHCVASYAGSCASGRCSIWTMELHGFSGVQKRQTIEVNRQGVVVQCRGRFNAAPNDQEREILGRWVAQEGLQIGRFVS